MSPNEPQRDEYSRDNKIIDADYKSKYLQA
jgi:hypothetical protein